MKIEITKGCDNPVSEFFSSPSKTPETDANIGFFDLETATDANFARKLKRERDEARDRMAQLLNEKEEAIQQSMRDARRADANAALCSKLRDIAERAIWRAVNGVCLPDASAVRAIKEEGLRLRAELDQLKESVK
jgi:hypothetical protein